MTQRNIIGTEETNMQVADIPDPEVVGARTEQARLWCEQNPDYTLDDLMEFYRTKGWADPMNCPDCDCPKGRCDGYGYGRKCCPDCKHRPISSVLT